MSKKAFRPLWPLGLLLLLSACRPGVSTPGTDGQPEAAAKGPAKRLTVILQQELENIATAEDLRLAVNQTLTHLDHLGGKHPMLATELPSQDRGTWTIRPNGTMQTIYRLHSNVTWHDGTPLTPRDFVFALTVSNDPELSTTTSRVAGQIDRIDAPDDLTLVIEWARTYPFADAIVESELGPLASHLLEPIYLNNKPAYETLPYWTREFVGVGPYRLIDWQAGSHLVVEAYDRFYRGRGKIDLITFRFINDPQVVLANLLAGEADGAIPRATTFSQTRLLERQWRQAGKNPLVLYQPVSWIEASVQFNNPRPRELLDPRARSGLLHALDRQAMVDALWEGEAPLAHFFMTETDVRWDWVRDAVTKYALDPSRSRGLLQEVGWQYRADGTLVSAAGEPVVLSAWATPGGTHTDALPIMADNWKAVGISVDQFVIPRAAMTDNRFRASFTGLHLGGNPINPFRDTQDYQAKDCPKEENRWAGGRNRGCYGNPEWDRLGNELAGAIDPGRQREIWRAMARTYTEDLPSLPIMFFLDTTVFRDGFTGHLGSTVPRTSTSWQIAQWDIR